MFAHDLVHVRTQPVTLQTRTQLYVAHHAKTKVCLLSLLRLALLVQYRVSPLSTTVPFSQTMKISSIVLVLAMGGASAFSPMRRASPRMVRNTVQMKSDLLTSATVRHLR